MNDELNRAISIAQNAHNRNDGQVDNVAVAIGALIRAVELLAGYKPAPTTFDFAPRNRGPKTEAPATEEPWNTCPLCKATVSLPDAEEPGSLFNCHRCNASLRMDCFGDDDWRILAESENDKAKYSSTIWLKERIHATDSPTLGHALIERLIEVYENATHQRAGIRAILAELAKMSVELPSANDLLTWWFCGPAEDDREQQARDKWDTNAVNLVGWLRNKWGPALAAKDARIAELEASSAATAEGLQAALNTAKRGYMATQTALDNVKDKLQRTEQDLGAKNDRIAELEKQLATARADIEAHVTQARFAAVNLGYPGKTLEDAVRAIEQQKILDGIVAKEAEREQRACVEALSESLLVMPGRTLVEAVKDLIELHGHAKKRVDELATVTSRQVETVKIESERAAYFEQKAAELEKRLADVSVPPTVDGKTPGPLARVSAECNSRDTAYYVWLDLGTDDACKIATGMSRDHADKLAAKINARAFGNQGGQTTTASAAGALQRVRERIGNIETHFRGADGVRLNHTAKGTIKDAQAVVDDELAKLEAAPLSDAASPKFFATDNELRGSYFCTAISLRPFLHISHDVGFDDIPRLLKLGRNDVIEIRVVQRAKQ